MNHRLFVFLLPLLFLGSCERKPAAPDVDPAAGSQPPTSVAVDPDIRQQLGIEVQTIQPVTSEAPVSATGQLQVNEDATWQIGSLTAGKVVSVPVKVGDQVREGQILASLHSHEVHDARASYRQAQAELQRQRAIAEQALTVRDRTRRLYDLRAASKEQLEAAETQYRSAVTGVTNAQAEADKAAFHLTGYLDVPVQAPVNPNTFTDTITIKSPAAGTLMTRKASAGTVVSVGDPVFTVSNLSTLWLIAAVSEVDLSLVHTGQRVGIRVRAFPDRTFPGTVLRIGERMDPQTRTLQVRVLVPNREGLLKPEMFATAEFQRRGARSALLVPEAAVQQLNGKPVVFVHRKNGAFEPAIVELGAKSDAGVEIVSGVSAGTPIAVKGAFLLKTRFAQGGGQ